MGFQKLKDKFKRNSHKTRFLVELPTSSVESGDLAERCKFNFSYYDGSQEPAVEISDLDHLFLVELLEKLRHFSRFKLSHWLHERAGSGGLKILSLYGAFPVSSDFKHPRNVPHDIRWARFRLDNMTRLIGFVVPAENSNLPSKNKDFLYDVNTFYVVFVDKDHRFYKNEDR